MNISRSSLGRYKFNRQCLDSGFDCSDVFACMTIWYLFHKCTAFKGTHCLGSVELVFEKRFVNVCYKMHPWVERCCKSRIYIMIHTNYLGISQFSFLCEETRSKILNGRKPRNFDGYLCRSLYSTFTTSF